MIALNCSWVNNICFDVEDVALPLSVSGCPLKIHNVVDGYQREQNKQLLFSHMLCVYHSPSEANPDEIAMCFLFTINASLSSSIITCMINVLYITIQIPL